MKTLRRFWAHCRSFWSHPNVRMTFTDETVRLTDLVPGDMSGVMVRGKRFTGCRIIGPCAVGLIGGSINACAFNCPGLDSMLIEVPVGQPLVGVIGIADCAFDHCQFEGVLFLASPHMAQVMREGIAGSFHQPVPMMSVPPAPDRGHLH